MASVKTQGSSLQLADGASPLVYTDITGVMSFTGPTGSRAVIDATTLASTGKEKDVGIPDFGQVTFEGKFTAGDPALIDTWDNFVAGTLHDWRLLFSDSPRTQFDFQGFVLAFSYTAGVDDIIRTSITIEISGTVTDNLA